MVKTAPKLWPRSTTACVAWPLNANATSAYSVLQWKKGGAGYGGKDDLGGDVFLSTTLNLGCGGGYFGSQMHWNTSSMNLDWAVWDIVSSVSPSRGPARARPSCQNDSSSLTACECDATGCDNTQGLPPAQCKTGKPCSTMNTHPKLGSHDLRHLQEGVFCTACSTVVTRNQME